uniref:UBIQUITIN_CONJUGAT_2 domain-containing protein n=1 Tax=Globodera pallida TaxID=36090 RepID=A0A183CIH9_GLOPA
MDSLSKEFLTTIFSSGAWSSSAQSTRHSGTFLAQLDFPRNYPQRPPKMRFLSDVLHPNIFKDGHVCISILHEQGDDPFGEEKATERWQPTLTVESIVISVQSMLSTPNFLSPANLDAALMFRTDILGYNDTVRQCVRQSNEMFEAEEQRHTNNHYERRGLLEHRDINHDDDDDLLVEQQRHNDPFGFLPPGEPRQNNNNDGGAERAIEAAEQRPNLVNFAGLMWPVYEPRQNNNNNGRGGRAIEAAEHRRPIDENYGFLPLDGQPNDAEENRHNEEEEDYVMGPLFGAEPQPHRQNNDDDEEDSF